MMGQSAASNGSWPRLMCIECGQVYDLHGQRAQCDCGGLLNVEHNLTDLDGDQLLRTFDERRCARTGMLASGVWRYHELIGPFRSPITRSEGNTGLYTHPKITRWTGKTGIVLKHEGENPTGSFKDRGMTVGVSQAVRAGAKAVVCASTGNTSSSLAAYAALAGIPCLVIVPHGKIASGKLAQSLAYGARVIQVEGDFDAALTLARQACQDMGLYLLNSINPWRLEGQKTIVLELLQQMRWAAPDWIVVPGGNLGNVSAFGKALRELARLVTMSTMPRLAVIQAEGANPFYQAYRARFREFHPVAAHTIATAINIGAPVNYPRARRAIEETDGIVAEVSDAEILEAKGVIDGCGIGCEPASAATLAGIRKLVREKAIRPGQTVAGILTGHLLKDPETTMAYHSEHGALPSVISADMGALRQTLERMYS